MIVVIVVVVVVAVTALAGRRYCYSHRSSVVAVGGNTTTAVTDTGGRLASLSLPPLRLSLCVGASLSQTARQEQNKENIIESQSLPSAPL